jgi:hypothetical protein
MNTPTIIVTIALCILLFFLPRKYFFLPFVITACFIPMNQRLIIAGLDLTILRILLLIGSIRLISKKETRIVQWNNFDKLILCWMVIGSVVYYIRWLDFSAVIYKSGVILDCLLFYWLSRQLIRNWDDLTYIIKFFAYLALITAPFIALEKLQQQSFFSLFGPVQGQFHRGRFRCAGPFPHYIMMGVFWASLLPLFYAEIKRTKNNLIFWIAIPAALSNVYFSASSTPIMTVIAVIIAWNLYKYRMHGNILLWVGCAILFSLHLVMKAPVWHLMSRVGVFGGSTGWYRYYLFDNFINHTAEWFLIGTKDTAHWGRGLFDITNQFVLEAVRGGFLTLCLFIAIIYNAIKISGNFSIQGKKIDARWIAWGLCVTMFGHFVSFWGVSYFGQIILVLYLNFAMVGFVLEYSKKENEELYPNL